LKLGIFSDVHGSSEALDAIVAALRDRGATRFVCCGDIVGYGPDPNRCIETVRSMRCACVAGNHDYGAVDKTSLSDFNAAAIKALRWTRESLTESNRRYLENLSLTIEDGSLLVVHSSPSAPDAWEYVLTMAEAADEMEHYPGAICVAGHSHRPLVVERLPGGATRLVREESFDVRPDAKYFINAGSVGQPRDGDARACGLLYDAGNWRMTRVRVRYDIAAVQAKIRAAGLPEFLAGRLALGQ
jgi:diadenosine tetraphosphatase ApaH/serine/threonine PP2A family protein phosphatase